MIELAVAGAVAGVAGLVTALRKFRRNRRNRNEQDYVTVQQELERLTQMLNYIESAYEIEFVDNTVVPTFAAFREMVERALEFDRTLRSNEISKPELALYLLDIIRSTVRRVAPYIRSWRPRSNKSAELKADVNYDLVFESVENKRSK